jgi:magnesium-transporting ATPase (P-type)
VTIDEACENLANEGLRTLVIAQRQIDEREFEEWQERYRLAKADLNNREKAMNKCVEDLECDMELVGVTGVEGKFEIDDDVIFR